MKKSVWIGIQNKERSVTLHGSLLSVWAGSVCCLLNHGNNPVSPPSPPAEAASVYFQSIEMWEAWPKLHSMNVNNCCRWPATMQPPLQHSPQPLQRCSTVCRQCEDMKHNQYVCTMHWLWTLYTMHAHFPQTLQQCSTADLAVATSGEMRRLIPVSNNHQPGLSDMQPAAGLW